MRQIRSLASVATEVVAAWWRSWGRGRGKPDAEFQRHVEKIIARDRYELLDSIDGQPTPRTQEVNALPERIGRVTHIRARS